MSDYLSNHARSLTGDEKRRYLDKIEVLGPRDPYFLMKDSSIVWTTDSEILPPITYPDIFNYLVLTKSFYTLEQFKAYKSLDAYNFFVSGWVFNAKWLALNVYVLVVAEVAHSQRMNDAKLLPWLVLKNCGSVWGAHCTCMAGLGECCSHVGALLFYLQFVYLKKSENSKSVTDVSAYWIIPSNQHADPKRISEINFDCPKSMLPQNSKKNAKSKSDFTKKLKTTLNDPQEFKNFLSNLEKINSNAAILRVVEPYNLKFVNDEFPKSLANLYKDEYSTLNLEELVCVGSKLDFSLTLEDCSSIEIFTKMQAKTHNWFLYRTGRITASRVKDVCSVKSSYSNKSLIKSICYPLKNTFKSIATEWGINHEEEAKASYMEKNKNHHIHFSMNNSGLVINPSLPYLGASPDGMINCDCCGKGCLEIKCPHTLSEGGETRSMSYLVNGHLSKNHQYYYQLQTQILLCGTQYGDFVVWSPNECYIERINIDPDIQDEILNKSKWFFYESILPELLGRYFSNTEIKSIETYDETLTYENCVCKKNTGGKMVNNVYKRRVSKSLVPL